MEHIELAVKPILEKMGLFEGKEVLVKDVFDEYLRIFPKGIGPLGRFMALVEYQLGVKIKEEFDGETFKFIFIYSYNPKKDMKKVLFNYDPRMK